MKATKQHFETLEKALEAIQTLATGYSLMYSHFVASDCKIDCDHIRDIFTKHEVRASFTEKYPFYYYFAFREHGSEGSEDKEYVKERCQHLGRPYLVARLTYIHGQPVEVSIETR